MYYRQTSVKIGESAAVEIRANDDDRRETPKIRTMRTKVYNEAIWLFCLSFLLHGCSKERTMQPTKDVDHATITASKLKYVPEGTKIIIRDASTVAQLRRYFTPDPRERA